MLAASAGGTPPERSDEADGKPAADLPTDDEPMLGDGQSTPVAIESPGPTAGGESWDNPEVREWATVLFAAAILGAGLFLLVWAFIQIDGSSTEAFEQRKDLLLVALGLMGTVTGYFFGRVPAENRAKTAEAQATNATQAAQQSAENLQKSEVDRTVLQSKVDDAIETVEQVQQTVQSVRAAGPQPTAAPGMPAFSLTEQPAGPPAADAELIRAGAQLDGLRHRLQK